MRRGIAATLFVMVAAGAAQGQAGAGLARPSAAVDELLWWLPPDTETIQVTQPPAKRGRGPLFDAIKTTTGQLEFGDEGYSQVLTRRLAGVRLKAMVDGARRFRPPSGLGGTRYEGANLFLLEKRFAGADALMAELSKTAVSVQRIEQLTVVEFREKLEDDIWSSFITFARPDVLAVATDRGYLEQVLRRRGARTAPRALPADLPEWRRLDAAAPFWAVRHYRRDDIDEDPTSPYRKDAAANVFDKDAVGVTVHATPDGRALVVHYLSDAPNAEALATRMLAHPGDGVSPEILRADAGVIAVRFAATDEEHLSMFLFYLLAALGHATYV